METPDTPKQDTPNQQQSRFKAFIEHLHFSDGTKVELGANDVVVVVGANNSGKTKTLGEIMQWASQDSSRSDLKIIAFASGRIDGTGDDVIDWFKNNSVSENGSIFYRVGGEIHQNQIINYFSTSRRHFGALGEAIMKQLNTADRLQLVNPPEVRARHETSHHPIQAMAADEKMEASISQLFRKAFGQDLIIHHKSGRHVGLYCGLAPMPKPDEDRVSSGYLKALEKLPTLNSQGDGMKAFAGVVLHTRIQHYPVTFVDEPEAFLHPPQARLLGRLFSEPSQHQRQFFLATHSGDFLRGVLDGSCNRVRILRLSRESNSTKVSVLDPADVEQLWRDPLLRFSNALDGLFHQRVVLCEGDADCRFYSALFDVQFDESTGENKPDVLFVHTGGKARLHVIAAALNAVKVPLTIIPDIDFLSDAVDVERLVNSIGGDYKSIEATLMRFIKTVRQSKTELESRQVLRDIQSSTSKVDPDTMPVFPESVSEEIRDTLRRSSPWSLLKLAGRAGLPAGQATQLFDQLNSALTTMGIHVVECGTLERWSPSIAGHGPKWVVELMKSKPNLRTDHELAGARAFVRKAVR